MSPPPKAGHILDRGTSPTDLSLFFAVPPARRHPQAPRFLGVVLPLPLLSFVSIVPLPLSRCSSTRPCEVCGSVSISLRPVRRAMLAKSGAHPGPGHLTNGSVLVLAGARRNLSQSTVQTLLLPRPDPRCPDPRCPNRRPPSPDPQIPDPQIPDPSSQIPAPILRLNPARGKRLGECLGSKMRSIFE